MSTIGILWPSGLVPLMGLADRSESTPDADMKLRGFWKASDGLFVERMRSIALDIWR